MTIIQASQTIDVAAAAREGFASGKDLTLGVIRLNQELGPWTVRIRLMYGPVTGPDTFSTAAVPSFGVTVREGGERGFHEWTVASEQTQRDASFVVYGSSLDVSVTIARAAAPRDCTLVAWLEKGACPETMLADTVYLADTIATWKARVIASGVDQTIPADVHSVDIPTMSEIVPGLAVPYPLTVQWVRADGTTLYTKSIAAVVPEVVNVAVPPNARWLALLAATGAGLSYSYPVVWRRH